jgi:hypothetical protein
MYQLTNENLIVLLVTIIWVLPWKAYSLWTASKRNEKWWFVTLIVVNTFGILEIFYIFYIAKKKWSDIQKVLHGILPKK